MNWSTRARIRLAAGVTVLLGATLLLAGPSEAATARAITAKANPSTALAAGQINVGGRLSGSPKGSSIKIQRYVGSSWVNAKATLSSVGGYYSTKVTLPSTAGIYKFRALAPATATLKPAVSRTFTVTALRKTRFYPVGGNDFLMQGSGPGTAAVGALAAGATSTGAKATLQRKVGSTWVTVGTSTVQPNRNFVIPYPNPVTGDFRVLIARKGLNSSATSRTEHWVFP